MKQPQKRLSPEERKKIILKSAVKVFARSNYRAAKMADIGAEITFYLSIQLRCHSLGTV
jgi:hypothetical protein